MTEDTAVSSWWGAAPGGERLVVVAAHPDDEVLSAGGLMRWVVCGGGDVVIVAVTDGEASHVESTRVSRDELRRRRVHERGEALDRLGLGDVEVIRLGIADRNCAGHVTDVARMLRAVFRSTDTVVGPAPADRHPDHVAVADAAATAAHHAAVVERWEAPTWALVHGTARPADRTLTLDDATWAAKRHAMEAFRSQLEPLGPDIVDGPVVHANELASMLRPVEGFSEMTRKGRR